MAQLTSKTQALVDTQVAVFRGDMVAIQVDVTKCMHDMKTDENRLAEVDNWLSASACVLAAHHARLEDKVANM